MEVGRIYSTVFLRSYIYLDEYEINNLYSQLYPDVLQEVIRYEVKQNNNSNCAISGSALGVIATCGKMDNLSGASYTSEILTKISTDYKTNLIIKHVCNDCIYSLNEIISRFNDPRLILPGQIIVGYANFYLTQIYDVEDKPIPLHGIKNNFSKKGTTFILESGNREAIRKLRLEESTDCYEDYFQSEIFGIEMHFGGEKLRREIRHLTETIKEGKVFRCSILGQISYCGMNQYFIKPFAVW